MTRSVRCRPPRSRPLSAWRPSRCGRDSDRAPVPPARRAASTCCSSRSTPRAPTARAGGARRVATPTFAALAARGVRFTPGLRHRAADLPVARLDADRALPGRAWRARERPATTTTACRWSPSGCASRLRDGGVRFGLSARPPVRSRARVRALRRRARRRSATSARAGRRPSRARLARARPARPAALPLGALLRPARAVRAARAVPLALRLGSLSRRDRVHGRASWAG